MDGRDAVEGGRGPALLPPHRRPPLLPPAAFGSRQQLAVHHSARVLAASRRKGLVQQPAGRGVVPALARRRPRRTTAVQPAAVGHSLHSGRAPRRRRPGRSLPAALTHHRSKRSHNRRTAAGRALAAALPGSGRRRECNTAERWVQGLPLVGAANTHLAGASSSRGSSRKQ